jgi:uncharacterized protein YprB with RNaseH-like and TPR domain
LIDPFARLSALKPIRRGSAGAAARIEPNATDFVAQVGGTIERNRYGEYVRMRQWYATPECGAVEPDALRLLMSTRDRPKSSRAAPQAAEDPRQWLFLDTETTGLAGGTGTYAFLVGLAWWDGGGLQVEQLFMRDHGEEHSLLLEVSHRLKERPVLVTFNGKSFDWPLLETRFRMTRSIEVPRFAEHLDFLHPARQLWRLQFDSLRLAELERCLLNAESLGWSRTADIDSTRIPEFYFEYLRGGPHVELLGVFLHNRMDLRGLAALSTRVLRALGDLDAASEQSPLELYGLSRLLDRRGERQRARATYERALAAGLPSGVAGKARSDLARLAKRERDFHRSRQLWQEVAEEDSALGLQALEQLAIHYERHGNDLAQATRLVRRAVSQLHRAERLGLMRPSVRAKWSEKFATRLARLERKLAAPKRLDSERSR